MVVSSYAELFTVLLSGSLVAVGSFIAFAVMREKLPEIYSWRSMWMHCRQSDVGHATQWQPNEPSCNEQREADPAGGGAVADASPPPRAPHPPGGPSRLPAGLFAWICPLWNLSLEDLSQAVGTDAGSYIALLHYIVAFLCTASLTLYPATVILYRTGGALRIEKSKGQAIEVGYSVEDQFRKGTLSNVPVGNWRLHAVVCLLWLFSALAFGFMYALLRRLVGLRYRSEKSLHALRHYTTLVEDIPEAKGTKAEIKKYFDNIIDGEVAHVTLVHKAPPEYQKKFDEYVDVWRHWKHYEDKAVAKPEAGPPMTRSPPIIGKKVQAIPYYAEKCAKLKPELEAMRHEHLTQTQSMKASTAFVTFKTLTASSLMQAAFVGGGDEGVFRVQSAPEPRDVVWHNLEAKYSFMHKVARIIGANLLSFMIVLYWAVPVAATQILADLAGLSRTFRWLHWIQDLPPSLVLILQSLLPVLTLSGLNAAAVPIFMWLSEIAGLERHSTVEVSTMWMNFAFLMFNSFFVVVSSGATLAALSRRTLDERSEGGPGVQHMYVDSFTSLRLLLGNSLPQTGAFFMNFVAGQAMYTPLALAIPPALPFYAFYKLTASSRQEVFEGMDPSFPWYGKLMSQDAFIFTITMCFALVSPGVLPFGAMYFMLELITYKYLLRYYYRTGFETGGRLLMAALPQFLFAIFLAQLTVMSCLALMKYEYLATCIPLPFLTIGFGALAFSPRGGGMLVNRGLAPGVAKKVEGASLEDRDGESPYERLAEETGASHARSVQALLEAEVEQVWQQPSLRMNLDWPRPREEFWLWEDIQDSHMVESIESVSAFFASLPGSSARPYSRARPPPLGETRAGAPGSSSSPFIVEGSADVEAPVQQRRQRQQRQEEEEEEEEEEEQEQEDEQQRKRQQTAAGARDRRSDGFEAASSPLLSGDGVLLRQLEELRQQNQRLEAELDAATQVQHQLLQQEGEETAVSSSSPAPQAPASRHQVGSDYDEAQVEEQALQRQYERDANASSSSQQVLPQAASSSSAAYSPHSRAIQMTSHGLVGLRQMQDEPAQASSGPSLLIGGSLGAHSLAAITQSPAGRQEGDQQQRQQTLARLAANSHGSGSPQQMQTFHLPPSPLTSSRPVRKGLPTRESSSSSSLSPPGSLRRPLSPSRIQTTSSPTRTAYVDQRAASCDGAPSPVIQPWLQAPEPPRSSSLDIAVRASPDRAMSSVRRV